MSRLMQGVKCPGWQPGCRHEQEHTEDKGCESHNCQPVEQPVPAPPAQVAEPAVKRRMILPNMSSHPEMDIADAVHFEDDWCPKARCIPYCGPLQPKPRDAGSVKPPEPKRWVINWEPQKTYNAAFRSFETSVLQVVAKSGAFSMEVAPPAPRTITREELEKVFAAYVSHEDPNDRCQGFRPGIRAVLAALDIQVAGGEGGR